MSKFFTPTPYNGDTKTQMWMSMISDGHDICCCCPTPFAHLLDCIFPPGHQDRNKTIDQIIARDIQLCRSGGLEESDLGIPLGGSAATAAAGLKEDPDTTEENIDQLLAAAAAAAENIKR